MLIDKAITAMKHIFQDIPYGIEHTLTVLEDAQAIMAGEKIDEKTREQIALVVVLHDIGAVEALRKYGTIDGVYQEQEGPGIARAILEEIGCDSRQIERICFIIGHHHTPDKIDGIDFQVQWEADLLANLAYMNIRHDPTACKAYIDENFKTATGKAMAYTRFIS